MFKRSIRWIIPLLVLVAFAAYFVVGTAFHTHAATTTTTHSVSDSGNTPNVQWNYP